VARRVTANDEAARDISQTVFLRLVKKAKKIPPSLPLTAWFHRETHSASVDYVRSEIRRQKREQTAASLDAMNDTPEPWNQLAPEIDSAINELSKNDRSLVLLRFYQNKTHPQIADELGIKEDAARMRTNRALEKLRTILTKRGITTSAALLASTLPTNAINPAPASLATSITTSLQTLPATTGTLAIVKTHLLTLGAIAIGAAAVTTQQIKINRLQEAQHEGRLPPATSSSSRSTSTPRTTNDPNLLAIFANPDPSERLHLLQQYSLHLPTNRISETLDLLRQKTPDWDSESKMLTHLLLTRWAKDDPEAAFSSLDNTNFSLERGHAISVLAALTSLDPQRTANWLTSPESSQAFYPVVGHILSGTIAKEWVRQDPKAALDWSRTLADQQQAGAYSGVLGTIAATNPQKAASLALTLEPGDARDHILSEIAESWARHSPKEALAWTTKLDSDEKSHTTAVALKSWSKTDPAKATNWVASKSQSPERNSALGKTLWNWTTQNPAAATAWVQSQPDGPAKDQALAGLAIAAVEFDPHTALEWAQKISESSFRDELTRRTFTTVIPKPPTNGGKENNFKSDD
tara:strand:- start:3825 stop:5564 length:1740 start_codon:yes stop_codon:yes gene_type:complete